jgi:phosphoribosylformylglycinamidine cyclo-ligase
MTEERATYAAAGVDLDAAEAAVAAIRPHVERTHGSAVLDSIGGFGGLFRLDTRRHKRPVLVSATDGVGTKLELARALGRHETIGIDLVAMVVDDLVVTGAEPLFFLDYIAVGKVLPEHIEQIVAGIADGCEVVGCALVGGEIAEHPDVLAADQYDVAGFAVGVVDERAILGPARVAAGDAIVALASSGLHANGYSLARRVVGDRDLSADHGLLVHSLGEALLRPTRIYTPDCLALARHDAARVKAFCHVTGGGIPGNLPRCLPEGLGAVVDTRTVEVPRLFRLLQEWGRVDEAEMWRVFNMGAGMLAIVEDAEPAVDLLRDRGVDAWVCGAVTAEPGVRLAGLGAAGD